MDKDFISAKMVMHASTRLYRVDRQGTKEFLSEYIKIYNIWTKNEFWEEYFWEMLSKKNRESMSLSVENMSTAEREQVVLFVDTSTVENLLLTFSMEMIDWNVPFDQVKKFVATMCTRNSLIESHQAGILVYLPHHFPSPPPNPPTP